MWASFVCLSVCVGGDEYQSGIFYRIISETVGIPVEVFTVGSSTWPCVVSAT